MPRLGEKVPVPGGPGVRDEHGRPFRGGVVTWTTYWQRLQDAGDIAVPHAGVPAAGAEPQAAPVEPAPQAAEPQPADAPKELTP